MVIESARYSFPTTIDFGVGKISNLPQWVQVHGGRKPLIVTDPGLLDLRLFATAAATLRNAGMAFEVFGEVSPNPTDLDVHKGAAFLHQAGCDLVIGLGGGSAIDAAKAIALMATHTGSILDYDYAGGGSDRMDDTLPPLLAIPTTAGTGSEVGRSTVIVDTHRRVKVVVSSPFLMPTVAIIDPALHAEMPPWLTAATGMDALTRCVEALLSRGFHPMADSIALGGIRLCAKSLGRAHEDGSDLDARGMMAMAAAMGATASQKGLGVVHSLARPASSVAGVHHGLASGVLLEAGLRFNRDHVIHSLANMARAVGLFAPDDEALADAAIGWACELRDAIGIPSRLRYAGVAEEHLPEMVRQAYADGCHHGNPVAVTPQDIRDLYRAAF